MMEAPALRAFATACTSEHEEDSVSKWCRASAASEEQPERTSRSQANSQQLSGQRGTGAGAKRHRGQFDARARLLLHQDHFVCH